MGDCLFCAIATGDIPSASVHEDQHTLAFMDIQPLREGHALVIPKAHAQRIEDLGPADLQALMTTTQHVIKALKATLGVEDTTVAINNGPAAGQEVPHVHIHIVPRTTADAAGPIHALFTSRPDIASEDIQALATRLRAEVMA